MAVNQEKPPPLAHPPTHALARHTRTCYWAAQVSALLCRATFNAHILMHESAQSHVFYRGPWFLHMYNQTLISGSTDSHIKDSILRLTNLLSCLPDHRSDCTEEEILHAGFGFLISGPYLLLPDLEQVTLQFPHTL